jgi:hypothetical protein
MVDGRIALGMVARATSGNRRGGQKRQVGIGRRRTCVVRRWWWWWWWCGGVVLAGRARRCFVPRLLIRARPTRLLCLMTPKAPSHTHHTSHITHAERCHGYLPCTSLPGSTTTEPERLTAPVVQCECSTHTLALSLSHSQTLSLLITAAPDSKPFGQERAINPIPQS